MLGLNSSKNGASPLFMVFSINYYLELRRA
jgi:hypothetical protein